VSKERIDAASRDATDTANVTIGSGALSSVGDVFGQSFGERTAVVVTDENAWAAGERVQRHLEAAGRETVEKFADSYRELMEEIEKQGRTLAR
jgi:hypothetical protein